MKKVILGSTMVLAGIISMAVIFAGSMAQAWDINGQFSAIWNIQQFGLMPLVYMFAGVSIIGLVLAIWGLIEKKD